jgi:hypothetical protein
MVFVEYKTMAIGSCNTEFSNFNAMALRGGNVDHKNIKVE